MCSRILQKANFLCRNGFLFKESLKYKISSPKLNLPISRTLIKSFNRKCLSTSRALKPNPISWGRTLALGGVAGGAILGGYYYYTEIYNVQSGVEAEPEPIPLPPEPEEYVHPYNHWPWYSRYWFITRRTCYLVSLWSPCIFAVIYMVLFGKESDDAYVDWVLDITLKNIEKSGAGFQKFGQWVAMRPDLFPRKLCKAMAKLHDDAPSHDYEHTRKVIQQSFNLQVEDIFEHFDEAPIASGSVGQVHKGRLRKKYALPDGRQDVAVKVRHPTVLDSSYADIWLIFWVMRSLPAMGIRICVPFKEEEFYKNIQRQVDFQWEAYNLLKFNANFHGEASTPGQVAVTFPLVHLDLLSESVLVESWAPGENLSNMLLRDGVKSKVWGETVAKVPETVKPLTGLSTEEINIRKMLAVRCCDIAAKMFLRDNYIHGDLHAGNLLYSAKDNLITVVDAGLTTMLEKDTFVPFGDFLRALCLGDATVIVEKLVEFNVNERFRNSSIPAFTEDVKTIIDKYMGTERERQEEALVMGYIMGEVLNTIGKYSITLRGDVSSSLMTISISEGLILSLDPTFDLVNKTLPYFVRYAGWETLSAIRKAGYYSTQEKARELIGSSKSSE